MILRREDDITKRHLENKGWYYKERMLLQREDDITKNHTEIKDDITKRGWYYK